MSVKIIGQNLPSIPWEERPENCRDILWRYSGNPVIKRDAIAVSNSIFNSAVVPYGDGFAGVFRCDSKSRRMQIHAGFSKDAINWEIEENPISFIDPPPNDWKYSFAYDPRVCFLEDRYYVIWCNGFYGPTIGLGYTWDFKKFYQMENAFLPCNRNGVLFPRRINGEYMMLSRPSDNGQTAFGDIFISSSKDLVYWGKHRHVFGTYVSSGWQSLKVGAGTVPIETSEGWLIFYHGVLRSCCGYTYSIGAALLDLDNPAKVIARGNNYLLSPQMLYECVGDTPNVCFPCAALTDAATGRIAVYYGCADTVTSLAFCDVNEVIDEIRKNNIAE